MHAHTHTHTHTHTRMYVEIWMSICTRNLSYFNQQYILYCLYVYMAVHMHMKFIIFQPALYTVCDFCGWILYIDPFGIRPFQTFKILTIKNAY